MSILIMFLMLKPSELRVRRYQEVTYSKSLLSKALNIMHRHIFSLLAALLIILYPLWLNEFLISVSIITEYILSFYGAGALFGYGGQFSFAQAVFYGLGAYNISHPHDEISGPGGSRFFSGGVSAGAFGYVLSAPILRLRGYYLAVATLAVCQIFHVLIIKQFNVTGGPTGT